jgi:hypothetical protein
VPERAVNSKELFLRERLLGAIMAQTKGCSIIFDESATDGLDELSVEQAEEGFANREQFRIAMGLDRPPTINEAVWWRYGCVCRASAIWQPQIDAARLEGPDVY